MIFREINLSTSDFYQIDDRQRGDVSMSKQSQQLTITIIKELTQALNEERYIKLWRLLCKQRIRGVRQMKCCLHLYQELEALWQVKRRSDNALDKINAQMIKVILNRLFRIMVDFERKC